MEDRQRKLYVLTFVAGYTSHPDHTKTEGSNKLGDGQLKDQSKCKTLKGKRGGVSREFQRTYSTMKTVLQLICAPKSFTCNSPPCRSAPSTVLSFVSSARGFLSPLTVIFCRADLNYSKKSVWQERSSRI